MQPSCVVAGVRPILIFMSRVLYVLATLAMLGLAFGFIAYAGLNIYAAIAGRHEVLDAMLGAVGLIIIALAVSDVGKFLLEEELAGDRELATTAEVRRTLTKFLTIIIVAASLEALVFIFESGRERIEHLVYPVALLFAVAVLLIVMGVYQRLTHAAEHERRVDEVDGLPVEPEERQKED